MIMELDTQRQALVQALRDVRAEGPFEGRLFLRCEYPDCCVRDIDLRIVESRPGGKPVAPRLLCPVCKREAMFYELTGQ
jgi:hypothetical protein